VSQGRDPLLDVRNLRTSFFTDRGEVKAVNDVSFHVDTGEVVAIVGESGCGKSVTQLSVIQLVQSPPGKVIGGEVMFDNLSVLDIPPASPEMRRLRGAGIAMIFQEPMTSLNPVLTVGKQLSEVVRVHEGLGRKAAWARGVEALQAVGIPDPEARMHNYPFEMSGGMRQRVMIAVAVACRSKLIIADEPTTALDVTTQAQVMELLVDLTRSRGTSLVVITHNLGLVSRYAERVYVMYAGRVVEEGTTEELLTRPAHPYTIGLLASIPKLEGDVDDELTPIEGAPPDLADLPPGCAFAPRCPRALAACAGTVPGMRPASGARHRVACHLWPDEEMPQ